MLFTFFSTAFFSIIFFEIGDVFQNTTKIKVTKNPFIAMFTGISLCALYFSIVSLFLPLTVFTLLPLICIGFIGFIIKIKSLLQSKNVNLKACIIVCAILFLISVFISAVKKVDAYDTLLYHSSVVSWINESKVVPGIANLHGRLGMNSLYLILAAGIDVSVFNKYSSYILLAVFYFSFTMFFLHEFLVEEKKEKLIALVMLCYLFLNCKLCPSLYYDVPAMIFTGVLLYELLHHFEKKEDTTSFSLLFIFASVSFCIKQMGALNLILVFVFGIIDLIKTKKISFLRTTSFVLLPLLFGATYIARNLIQTGYPLFPLPLLPVNFKWTVSASNIQGTYDDIKYWARLPGSLYMSVKDNGFLYWFIPWLKALKNSSNMQFLCLGVISAIAFVVTLIKTKNKRIVFPFLVLLLNILFWFASAPDFRFISIIFYALFALAVYYYDFNKSSFFYISLFSVITIFCVASSRTIATSLILLFILVLIIAKSEFNEKNIIRCVTLLGLVFLLTNIQNRNKINIIFPPKVESEAVTKVEIQNEQTQAMFIYIPVNGDQCGDATLPCAPSANNNIKQIIPGNIYSGYYCK